MLAVSRSYQMGQKERFWFAFHLQSKIFLSVNQLGWVAFGCGFGGDCILLSWQKFEDLLPQLNSTIKPGRPQYWHVTIENDAGIFSIIPKAPFPAMSLVANLL